MWHAAEAAFTLQDTILFPSCGQYVTFRTREQRRVCLLWSITFSICICSATSVRTTQFCSRSHSIHVSIPTSPVSDSTHTTLYRSSSLCSMEINESLVTAFSGPPRTKNMYADSQNKKSEQTIWLEHVGLQCELGQTAHVVIERGTLQFSGMRCNHMVPGRSTGLQC